STGSAKLNLTQPVVSRRARGLTRRPVVKQRARRHPRHGPRFRCSSRSPERHSARSYPHLTESLTCGEKIAYSRYVKRRRCGGLSSAGPAARQRESIARSDTSKLDTTRGHE